MTSDFAEVNAIGDSTGSFSKGMERVSRVIDHCSWISNQAASVQQGTATRLLFSESYFDIVITDPPYYDNVPYSYLSDFFYVWLKRSIGSLYPELFSTPLTPKSKEIVAYSNGEGGWEGGKTFFENMLKKSFTEINRVLKPNGISIIVYAHKSTAGWETLVNSLLDSGLVITAAWPIHTEMGGRLRAMESAALGSSIYIVARNLKKSRLAFIRR
jgi:adenine-specific DNA methylase